jgi:hypothetical protein
MKKLLPTKKEYQLFQRVVLALEDSAHHCWCSELAERGMGKSGTAAFCKGQMRRMRRLSAAVNAKYLKKGFKP